MLDPLATSAALSLTLGTGLVAGGWMLLRNRLSIDWEPGSGVDGNRIYALQVALTRRDQPERSLRLYVYVASRTPASPRGAEAPAQPRARDLTGAAGAGSPGSD